MRKFPHPQNGAENCLLNGASWGMTWPGKHHVTQIEHGTAESQHSNVSFWHGHVQSHSYIHSSAPRGTAYAGDESKHDITWPPLQFRWQPRNWVTKTKTKPTPHPLCKFTFLCRVAGVATPNHTACGPWVEHAQLVDIWCMGPNLFRCITAHFK